MDGEKPVLGRPARPALIDGSLIVSLIKEKSMRGINEDPARFGIASEVADPAFFPQIGQHVSNLCNLLFNGQGATDFVQHELIDFLSCRFAEAPQEINEEIPVKGRRLLLLFHVIGFPGLGPLYRSYTFPVMEYS